MMISEIQEKRFRYTLLVAIIDKQGTGSTQGDRKTLSPCLRREDMGLNNELSSALITVPAYTDEEVI